MQDSSLTVPEVKKFEEFCEIREDEEFIFNSCKVSSDDVEM